MLTSSAHTNQHHHHLLHHLPQSTANNNMPVAASPCSTSSSSLGYHQASSSSMSSSVSDLLNSSHSSFGESSASSVRSLSAQRHEPTSTSSSSVPRVRTIRLKRPSIPTNVVQQQPQQPMQSRNLLIGGGAGGGSAAAVTSMEMSGLIASPSNSLLFGFSIRGGSEYRTGFFVSHVEPAGEADVQGVQVRCLFDGYNWASERCSGDGHYYDGCANWFPFLGVTRRSAIKSLELITTRWMMQRTVSSRSTSPISRT